MRHLQRTLFGLLLCCLAPAANAQWPMFLPSLDDQYRQQRDEARRLQSLTADSLARCWSLLAATRQAYQKLDQLRLARIDSLVKQGNHSIDEQSEARQEAEERAGNLADQLRQVRSAILEEQLTARLLGWGRKRALKRIWRAIPDKID